VLLGHVIRLALKLSAI